MCLTLRSVGWLLFNHRANVVVLIQLECGLIVQGLLVIYEDRLHSLLILRWLRRWTSSSSIKVLFTTLVLNELVLLVFQFMVNGEFGAGGAGVLKSLLLLLSQLELRIDLIIFLMRSVVATSVLLV